ncbi:MAG: DNA replication protein DnaD, partial [Oscillibacter sp.]|nr:DNA replication protein DnaD [Oscillibacter sp.]
MPNILLHTGDEPFLIPPKALKCLLDRGDGDAALLYLALLRHQGTLSPRALTHEMRWETERMDAAETVLGELGL